MATLSGKVLQILQHMEENDLVLQVSSDAQGEEVTFVGIWEMPLYPIPPARFQAMVEPGLLQDVTTAEQRKFQTKYFELSEKGHQLAKQAMPQPETPGKWGMTSGKGKVVHWWEGPREHTPHLKRLPSFSWKVWDSACGLTQKDTPWRQGYYGKVRCPKCLAALARRNANSIRI